MDVSMIPIFIMVSTMIELSSKIKNFIFWGSITLIFFIVFGVFVIDIFVYDAQGKDKLSIIFSFLSAFFALLSSLGILITIGVYFSQKNDDKRKQKEMDEKLIHFVNEKAIDFINKINRVLFLIENEDKYHQLEIDGYFLCYVEAPFQDNPIFHRIDLRLNTQNSFLDRHGVQASLGLFKFIIEIDSSSEDFFNKTSYYIRYGHELIAHYIPEISDSFHSEKERTELIIFLNQTKDDITLNLSKFIK